MTLQQIADYAMEYLDSKGVAADYDIYDNNRVRVLFLRCSVRFGLEDDDVTIRHWIDHTVMFRFSEI